MPGSRGLIPSIALLLALASLVGCESRAEPSNRELREAGYYPPTPSLAGEMTPEAQEFALRADRTCAIDFAKTDRSVDIAYAIADQRGFGTRKAEAITDQILGSGIVDEARDLRALGRPPERAALYRKLVSNMERRGEMRLQVGKTWLRGQAEKRSLLVDRIDAAKIDFNLMGRRFGLQVCTSNGPGLEPDDYPADSETARNVYLGRLNEKCELRDRHEEVLEKRGDLHEGEILGASLGETISMAAVGPPLGSYGLREQILDTKRSLDRYWKSMIAKVNRSQAPNRTFMEQVARWTRLARSVQRELRKLGLPRCSNWGPDTNH
jgi:hypothetical protein